jgi:hypothetical protein
MVACVLYPLIRTLGTKYKTVEIWARILFKRRMHKCTFKSISYNYFRFQFILDVVPYYEGYKVFMHLFYPLPPIKERKEENRSISI